MSDKDTDCKHMNQTKKRYPRLAKCKDCGKLICPDCDGTKVAMFGPCSTCNGKGVIEEDG